MLKRVSSTRLKHMTTRPPERASHRALRAARRQ